MNTVAMNIGIETLIKLNKVYMGGMYISDYVHVSFLCTFYIH